jgi:hypothetical protein
MVKSHQTTVTLFLVRLGLFVLLFSVVEIGVFALLHQRFPTFFHEINPNKVGAGTGNSLARFRDIEKIEQVDILLIGSSHAYRGLDPSIFAKYGYSSFNIGSTSARALNTYVMLKEYLPRLKPRLVVFEAFFVVTSGDGLESYYDLLANMPFSSPIIEMALRIGKMESMKALFLWSIKRAFTPYNDYRLIRQRGCNDHGYCSTRRKALVKRRGDGKPSQGIFGYPKNGPESAVALRDDTEMQLDYLGRTLDYCLASGTPIVVVVHPLPHEYKLGITDKVYERLRRIELVASERGVGYYDFNYTMRLDSRTYFMDRHHLNQAGVNLFNAQLIEMLKAKNYL